MPYTITTTIDAPFDDVVDAVTTALQDEGFGILTDINVQTTLKDKLDVDVDRYRILGACNPPLAHEGLVEEPELGALLLLKTVAKRAAIRAATATGVGELQTEHIQTAAANVADEWDCSSTDSESTGRRRDDTGIEELVSATVPEVSFDDVGGLQNVKQRLQELLVYPEECADVIISCLFITRK